MYDAKKEVKIQQKNWKKSKQNQVEIQDFTENLKKVTENSNKMSSRNKKKVV